ncbi:MAG TPA: ribosome biogenesis GTPase Der [Acidimicrobiales bacterium]|nr:ribosome biogenesis GTPase Der [Acidimicrobiales bacterium]
MTLPVIAIVGRPNVGKSTLVNRIVGRREAIVEEQPGVTRDRKELETDWRGRRFMIVDTGGWMAAGDGLDAKVSEQAERAIKGADVVLFVTDATVGVTEEDDKVAAVLRRAKRPVVVVVNKVDSEHRETDAWDFARLGLGEPIAISAIHGRQVGDLLDAVFERLPPPGPEELPADETLKVPSIAVVGRPNVGKSTLFNRLIGDDRSVVHDQPGTTRDSIDTVVETPDGPIRFIDTAGMRRKSKIVEGTEYYSLVRALQTVDRADAAMLVIDASEGVTHQDQRLAERIDVAGSPVLIVLNKYDLLGADARAEISEEVADRLAFLGYAPVLKISALTGKGVQRLLPAIQEAIAAYHRRVPTRELNEVVQAAQAQQPAPNARVLYATQGATDPPTFTLFTNRALPAPYLRYLERRIREHFGFGPTPLKLRVRSRTS